MHEQSVRQSNDKLCLQKWEARLKKSSSSLITPYKTSFLLKEIIRISMTKLNLEVARDFFARVLVLFLRCNIKKKIIPRVLQ